jgi:hypothetical protein
MSTFAELYDAALLAHAAYLAFPEVEEPSDGLAGEDLEDALLRVDSQNKVRFTALQATYLAERYVAVAYRSGGLLSGFQAVAFRDTGAGGAHADAGRLTVAFRGTEKNDYADYAGDGMAILSGGAWNQLSTMEEFIADLKAPGSFGEIGTNESINLAGHSLGGHLAHFANGLSDLAVNRGFTFNSL